MENLLNFQILQSVPGNESVCVGICATETQALDILSARAEKCCLKATAEKDFVFGQVYDQKKLDGIYNGYVIKKVSDVRYTVYQRIAGKVFGYSDYEVCSFIILAIGKDCNDEIEKRDNQGKLDKDFKLEVSTESIFINNFKNIKLKQRIGKIVEASTKGEKKPIIPPKLNVDLAEALRKKFQNANNNKVEKTNQDKDNNNNKLSIPSSLCDNELKNLALVDHIFHHANEYTIPKNTSSEPKKN